MENFIVSARKYRPATFQQVVGQDAITSTLKNAIKNKHVAQAFLFTGPRGVGKTTCARILAKTINCINLTAELEPCDTCESCTSFNNNASFNIHELDAASNNSVEDIRTLVEQVRIPPQIGNYKVYIIDEVHMLSAAAFNAFLKTLEEPPAYAKFILATTEKHKIIPTILSRCQIFDFRRISVEDIAQYLSYVAKNEGIDAEYEALHIIAQKSDGALRDALSTFDQIVSFAGTVITYKSVIENLNILDYEYYFRVTDSILTGDISELLLTLNEIVENGFDGQHFITGLNEHLRNLLVIKQPGTIELLLAGPALKVRYKEQADYCSVSFLFKAMEICNKYDLSYKSSNNKRLHVEIALMQLSVLNTGIEDKPIKKAAERAAETPAKKAVLVPLPAEPSVPKLPPVSEKPAEYPEKKKSDQPADAKKSEPVKRSSFVSRPEDGKRGLKNISITGSLAAAKEMTQSSDEVEEKVILNDFTEEQLIEAWNLFAESYKSKAPSFTTAISKYSPVLKEDFNIEYKVDNIIIAQDTLNITTMLDFLKKELKNNQIKLNPVIPAKTDKKVAYTDKEKFEEMAAKYPNLLLLKDQLNLELDF